MFESLSDRLSGVFDKLRGKGALSEQDVAEAMREVRVALLEADVSLSVVKDFIDRVKAKAVGQEVTRSVTPGQQVVKIVFDEMAATLGAGADELPGIDLNAPAPVPILMVGLQGSGKTTSTAKIAKRLTDREKKKVMMASLDTRRPAAMEQLRVLGEQTGIATLPIVEGQAPVDIARRAIQAAKLQGFDVVMLDTAGRTSIDEALMAEVAEVRQVANPHEVLLVADSLTGQDAVNTAERFNERTPLTGIVLTRIDGDGRGGAALSMRAVTGVPIKLLGTGEKIDDIEEFHADRIANRILGMGDVVSLVEKASEMVEAEDAEKMLKKLKKGQFDLDDLAAQLKQMRNMGGMGGIMGMLPGVGKMKKQIDAAGMDDSIIQRQEAIISSMTLKERTNPKLLNGSRKKRIAAGSGTGVPEVNKLLKMHRQMADMMKKMGKAKGGLAGMFGGGGGMPDPSKMNPAELEAMAKQMPGGGLPGGMGGGLPGLGGGLPGLGGGLPGLGGAPFGKGRKK